MTESAETTVNEADDVSAENVASRAASLLPEELAVGSDNPEAQAAAILRESAERTADPHAGL